MPHITNAVCPNANPCGARRRHRRVAAILAAAVLLLALQLIPASPAEAHGAQTRPGSRTYLCRIDGTHASGDINPSNAACAAAVALGGKQPLWDWFGVLRSDGAGRTRGYIPDGRLCSGGEPKYAGYDLPRSDWPYTSLTAGTNLSFRYNAWAAHPGEFRLYVTKDGYDPTKPLGWDDLEPEPFSVYDQNSPNGNDAQNGTPDYQWSARLPQKSGAHIIYSVWSRSDSDETFYGCSDVRFDGGNGEVVGVGAGANPVGAPDGGVAPIVTVAPTSDGSQGAPATTVAPEQTTSIPQAPSGNESGNGTAATAPAMEDRAVGAAGGDSVGTDSSIAGSVAATAATENENENENAARIQSAAANEVAPPADGSVILAAAAGDGSLPVQPTPIDDVAPVSVQSTAAGGNGAGSSWPTLLAGVAIGLALGVISCIALYSTLKVRRLQDRLNTLDRAKPGSSNRDRFDGAATGDGPPNRPTTYAEKPAMSGLGLD